MAIILFRVVFESPPLALLPHLPLCIPARALFIGATNMETPPFFARCYNVVPSPLADGRYLPPLLFFSLFPPLPLVPLLTTHALSAKRVAAPPFH